MEFTVERVYTSTFPSGKKCGTFVVRAEIEPEETPSEVGITCAATALQVRIQKWWEEQSGSPTQPA